MERHVNTETPGFESIPHPGNHGEEPRHASHNADAHAGASGGTSPYPRRRRRKIMGAGRSQRADVGSGIDA